MRRVRVRGLVDKTRAYVFEVIESDGRLNSLKELLVDHHREVNVEDDAVVDGQPKDLESTNVDEIRVEVVVVHSRDARGDWKR